jgi:hypothetical protein
MARSGRLARCGGTNASAGPIAADQRAAKDVIPQVSLRHEIKENELFMIGSRALVISQVLPV